MERLTLDGEDVHAYAVKEITPRDIGKLVLYQNELIVEDWPLLTKLDNDVMYGLYWNLCCIDNANVVDVQDPMDVNIC